MTNQEKLSKVQEMLATAGFAAKRADFTNGGGSIRCEVKGKPVEIRVNADGVVETSKYAYLLPGTLDADIETL